jgi:hypothetical protein
VIGDSTVALYVPRAMAVGAAVCAPGAGPAVLGYRARVGRLAARAYAVRVVHGWPGDGPADTTALAATVAVP